MSDLKERLKEKAEVKEQAKEIVESSVDVQPGYIQNEMQISAVPNIAINMEEAKERIQQLQDFIKYMMVPGIDFGFIQGCPKPMLFKAGAEKLCDIYGLTKQIEIQERLEDFDKGIFHYQVKAILVNKKTGLVESEGVGSCNNKEKKFASQDPFSVVNSVLKMAKKRAIVDATLAATRTSGIFGQDLENPAA